MRSPLLDRLIKQDGIQLLDAGNVEAFIQQGGDTLLFCTGDPLQRPEANDLAVILPELAGAFDRQFNVGVADAGIENDLQARYGFNQWPSLVLLRDGEYLGCVSRLRDWSVYLQEISRLLNSETSRPPSIGVKVVEQNIVAG